MSFGEKDSKIERVSLKPVKLDKYNFYKFWLDFVIESCLQYKEFTIAQQEECDKFYSLTLISKFENIQLNALRATKEVIKVLRVKIDSPDDVFNMELLKFSRSLTAGDCTNSAKSALAVIPQLKKVFIYLRE